MNDLEQWYFVNDGEHGGPVSSGALTGMIQSGVLRTDVPVFREGMSDWMPASELGLAPSVPTTDELRSEIARTTVSKTTALALTAALILTALAAVGGLWFQHNEHQGRIAQLNTDLSRLQKDLTQTQADLNNYTGSTNEVDQLITQLRSTNNFLQTEHQRLTHHIGQLKTESTNNIALIDDQNSNIEKLNNQIVQLNDTLKVEQAARQAADRTAAGARTQIEAARASLTNTIAQAKQTAEQLNRQFETDKAALQQQIQDAAMAQAKLDEQIKTLQSQLEQANTVITNLQAQLGQTPIRIGEPGGPKPPVGAQPFGQIGSVDEQFNFAVINRGSEDGVKAGDTFRVVSKETGEFLLQLKVDRVQATIAVASPGALSVKPLKPEDWVYRE